MSNREAELSVLGAVLLSPTEGADQAVELLRPEDFYHPAHRAVFESIVGLYDEATPIDPITVSDRLRASGELERVGGVSFVAELFDAVPTASNLPYYADLVKSAALRRRLVGVTVEIQRAARAPDRRISDVLDEAEQAVFGVAEGREAKAPQLLGSSLAAALERFERAQQGESPGLLTGYKDVDRLLGGLKPGNLVVLAARPSMGKSSWALGAAHHAAESGIPVAFFSLEMSRSELTDRLVCSTAGVDSAKAQEGALDDGDWARLAAAASRLGEIPIYIEDAGASNITTLRARSRRITRAAGGLGLVVVDYIQLMDGRGENRQQEVASVARGLKQLARDLEVPVLALSQLNRGVETRENKRPRLADLRDSGSIEQDADVVLFLYREEYYSPGDDEVRGVAEIDCAKHRTGRTGRVLQTFLPGLVRFADAAGMR